MAEVERIDPRTLRFHMTLDELHQIRQEGKELIFNFASEDGSALQQLKVTMDQFGEVKTEVVLLGEEGAAFGDFTMQSEYYVDKD